MSHWEGRNHLFLMG